MKGINNSNINVYAVLLIAGILLVLYFLKTIINNQEKIISLLSQKDLALGIANAAEPARASEENIVSMDKGATSGDAKVIGLDDDEITAVILAAVSHASNIPLNSLKVKSIKKI